MVLILATEPDPREAIVRLMKRSAYVLVPFSILLIKYYPDLGRVYDPWSGDAANTGVTTNKNELGFVCLILGFFFFWHLLTTLRREKAPERRKELLLILAFLYMIGWLLFMAGSATSLVSLVLGMSIVLSFSVRSIDTRRMVAYWAGGLLIFVCAELFFGVTDILAPALGRDPTLSGRRELWDMLLTSDINPIVGAGFESFWLGEQAVWLWSVFWWRPNQAHNGYLEIYLNLGWIGIILLVGSILSAFWKARADLFSEFDFGRFRLGIVAITIVYNCTEGAFKGLHPVWFLFFIAAMGCPHSPPIPREVHSSLSEFRASASRGH
jgi:exopolysaccharide production protein ExoQ